MPQKRPRGLSLLEVLIAVVILAIVMSSVYMTLRTGTKAYTIGITHSEGDQTARFVIGQLTDDLRNLYYRRPAEYNVTRRQREAMAGERERQRLQSGAKISTVEDPNLPELGPKIDLAFTGSSSGELNFVRYQTLKRGEDRKPWGLARIRYSLSNGTLLRSIDDVIVAEADADGNAQPKPPPQVDKIAGHVKAFDLRYAYWFDKEWLLATEWDSNAERYRNPAAEDEEEGAESLVPGMVNPQRIRRTDDIPAWIEMTITFGDPTNTEKDRTYKQILLMPQSQETYIPPELEGRERKRDSRSRRAGNR